MREWFCEILLVIQILEILMQFKWFVKLIFSSSDHNSSWIIIVVCLIFLVSSAEHVMLM